MTSMWLPGMARRIGVCPAVAFSVFLFVSALISGCSGSASGTTPPPPPPPPPSGLTVTGMSPGLIPPNTSRTVRVFGTQFVQGATVSFGGQPGTNVQFVGSTELTVTTPALPAGAVSITVRNPNGDTATLSNGLNVGSTNEPAGLAKITERNFSGQLEDSWVESPANIMQIRQDPLAPESPPNVGEALFPAGFSSDGMDPFTQNRTVPSGTKQLYLRFWVQLSSNWQGHDSSVNKVIFLWISDHPMLFFNAMGVGNGPLLPQVWLQDLQVGANTRNLSGNRNGTKQIQRSVWHQVEVLVRSNTPGSSNGEIRWWIDGTLIGEYTDVGFVSSGNSNDWTEIEWRPVWGGRGGPAVAQNMFMRMDHFYASGPSSASSSSPPVPDANDIILFSDDFESGSLSRWDSVDTPRYSIETDAARVRTGARSLRGLVSPSSWFGELDKWYLPGEDEIYVRFDVMFEEGFSFPDSGMHFVGQFGNHINDRFSASGKAGIRPNGTDFFLTFVDPEPPWLAGPVAVQPLQLYSQWPEMNCPSSGPCFGNFIRQQEPRLSFSPGIWHDIVFHIRANTPGQRDGSQTLWIDGEKRIDHQGLRFRDTLDLRLNQFGVLLYIENGAPRTQHVWFDNFLIWSPR